MGVCRRCKDDIPDDTVKVKCYGPCKSSYHIECSNLSVRTFRAKSEAEKKKWICVNCRENKIKKTRGEKVLSDNDGKTSENESSDGEDEEITGMTMEEKIDKILTGQGKINKAMDEFLKTVNKLQSDIQKRDEKIKEIEDELHDLQQQSRKNHLEIHNLPQIEGEDEAVLLLNIISVASAVGIEINEDDIEKCFRLNSKNKSKPKPIIIQFSSGKKRNKILAERKKIVTQDQILKNGNDDRTSRVYINESLTRYNKELLYKTKAEASKKGYKYVWTSDGAILMKKEEGARVIRIKNEDGLTKI